MVGAKAVVGDALINLADSSNYVVSVSGLRQSFLRKIVAFPKKLKFQRLTIDG